MRVIIDSTMGAVRYWIPGRFADGVGADKRGVAYRSSERGQIAAIPTRFPSMEVTRPRTASMKLFVIPTSRLAVFHGEKTRREPETARLST